MFRLKHLTITCSAALLALSLTGCGSKPSNTNSSTKPAAAPTTTSNTAAAAKPKTTSTPTTEIKNEKKPETGTAKSVPASKKVPAPANWIFMYDEDKGYSFYVPEGTKGGSDTVNGVNVFIAQTP